MAFRYTGTQFVSPIESFPAEMWDKLLAINLSACFHTIRLALPHMKDRGNSGTCVYCSGGHPSGPTELAVIGEVSFYRIALFGTPLGGCNREVAWSVSTE